MRRHCLPSRVVQLATEIGTQEILRFILGAGGDLEETIAARQLAEIAFEIEFRVNRVESRSVILA